MLNFFFLRWIWISLELCILLRSDFVYCQLHSKCRNEREEKQYFIIVIWICVGQVCIVNGDIGVSNTFLETATPIVNGFCVQSFLIFEFSYYTTQLQPIWNIHNVDFQFAWFQSGHIHFHSTRIEKLMTFFLLLLDLNFTSLRRLFVRSLWYLG